MNTLRNINGVLYSVFDLAVKDEIIRSNPCKGALVFANKQPGRNHGVKKALTKEEQTAFMDFIRDTPKYRHWLPIFTVMLGTGCRVGEIVGLRWCDIDLEKRKIDINHSIVYYAEQGAKTSKSVVHVSLPKTEAGVRMLPMSEVVYDAFIEEKENQQETGGNVA